MTPAEHTTQLSLVRSVEGSETHREVYPVREPHEPVTAPSAPLFQSEPFRQMRGQTSLPTDQL